MNKIKLTKHPFWYENARGIYMYSDHACLIVDYRQIRMYSPWTDAERRRRHAHSHSSTGYSDDERVMMTGPPAYVPGDMYNNPYMPAPARQQQVDPYLQAAQQQTVEPAAPTSAQPAPEEEQGGCLRNFFTVTPTKVRVLNGIAIFIHLLMFFVAAGKL